MQYDSQAQTQTESIHTEEVCSSFMFMAGLSCFLPYLFPRLD